MSVALDPSLLSWIERQCGGRVVHVEQQVRWRPHHFVTLERSDGPLTVVVRPDRKAVAGVTAFQDIAYEARVLEALQGRGLKVPRYFGFSESHRVLLMERAPGDSDLLRVSDHAVRERLMGEYCEQLARLHGQDLTSFHVPGAEVPATPEEAAFARTFRKQEQDYRGAAAVLPPDPLLELGSWWVRANVPRSDRPLSFMQADAGPGQFMFQDGELTALIDWELAEIGDPMRELANIRIRNMVYPTGSLRGPFARYEAASGRPIDWTALSFYTVLLPLGFAMGAARTIHRPSAQVGDMLQRFGWDATFRRSLCDALAEAISVELVPPQLPSSSPGSALPLADYLVEHLELNCLPNALDSAGRAPLETAAALARALQRESQIGARLLADDLDDMGVVLGRRPDDRAQGLAALRRLVEDEAAERLPELLRLFSRIERRREHLLSPVLIHQASAPFERLAP